MAGLDVTSLNVFALCAPCLRHAGKVMLAVVMAIAAVAYTAVLREALWPGIVHPSSWWSAALHTLVLVSYTALVRLLLPPLPPALRHARLSVLSPPCYSRTPTHPLPPPQLVMVLWCFFATFAAEPGAVPPGWQPFFDEEASATRGRPPPAACP